MTTVPVALTSPRDAREVVPEPGIRHGDAIADRRSRSRCPAAAPRTPNAIARRWSPCVTTRPRSGRSRAARSRMPSGSSSASAPSARRFATTAAMRSLSFTRSSAAPVIARLALGARGEAGEQRQLVDHRRDVVARRPSIAAKRRRRARRRSATGSPPSMRARPRRRSRAHLSQRVEEPGARLVHADVREPRARRCRRARRARRRTRPTTDRPARRGRAASSDRDGEQRAPSSLVRPTRRRPRAREHALGVIARALPARRTVDVDAGTRARRAGSRSSPARSPSRSSHSIVAQRAAVHRHRQAAVLRQLERARPSPRAAARRGASAGGSGSRRRRTSRRTAAPATTPAMQPRRRAAVAAVEVVASACAARAARRPRSTKSRDSVGNVRRRARAARPRWSARRPIAGCRVTRDSPSPSAPRISARCEIDLSPGTRSVAGLTVSSQPRLERGREIGLLVAVLHDHRRLEREPLLRAPAALDLRGRPARRRRLQESRAARRRVAAIHASRARGRTPACRA